MAEFIPTPGKVAAIKERTKAEKPRRYKVLLHNDNYTTMEFVVLILEEVFRKDPDDAVRIMLNVHQNGIGVAGVYIKAIAEEKVATVHELARDHGFPLRCSAEPE